MNIIDQIVEARIREAAERGEFDDLPGAGKPQILDDDSMIPAELRVGYRLLKNAGFLPPELELRQQIRDVEDLLAKTTDADSRRRGLRRLDLLRTQLEQRRGRRLSLLEDPAYRERLLDRMDGASQPGGANRGGSSADD